MDYEKEILNLKTRIEILEKLVLSSVSQKEENETKRDKTKYMYNSKVYPKNRLVLAIITDYVKNNTPSFEELQTKFDKSLQGSLNVVERLESALKISDSGKRYFIKEADQISLADNSTVVVCTQWGIFNIVKFIKQAKILGYEILEV